MFQITSNFMMSIYTLASLEKLYTFVTDFADSACSIIWKKARLYWFVASQIILDIGYKKSHKNLGNLKYIFFNILKYISL